MGGMFSLLIGIMGLIILAVFLVIAAILVGVVITGLIGGTLLLVTGNHFSKDTRKKMESRICIGVGIVFLILAGCSAGIIVNYVIKLFG